MYDYIIVGCGFSGAVLAERLANEQNKILIIDKRNHIAGNMYDYYDHNGVLVHHYGPHLFHTNHKEVYEYLSHFTDWVKYEHKVLGSIHEKLVPIPFNLTSIEKLFSEEKASLLKETLIKEFGNETKVPILELMKSKSPLIKELSQYIYENVFLNYTLKQWGITPEEIDPSVTSRVPVHISYDDRYFQDNYQFMPKEGYTKLFEKLLNHPNIEVKLGLDAKDLIQLDKTNYSIKVNNEAFKGKLIYTGPIDELFNYSHGQLPYRSLEFKFETHNESYYQPVGTVNYPNDYAYTRISEYKHFLNQDIPNKTTIVKEYPYPYELGSEFGNIPYYPIIKEENDKLYNIYLNEANQYHQLYLIGRLANYKYYNMDIIILEALKLFHELVK